MNITVNKTLVWIAIILFLIIAALITGFWWYDHSKLKKEIKDWKHIYYACKNAPTDTIKKKDSIVYEDRIVYKPYPVRVEIHDSIPYPVKGTVSWYDSVYKKDGWRIHYKIKTLGILDNIEFSDLVAPRETYYITRHIDTCLEQKTEKKRLFQWGLYTGMNINSFSKFPGLVIGGHTLIKEQLYIGLGGGYYKGFMGELRIGIFFNRNAKK